MWINVLSIYLSILSFINNCNKYLSLKMTQHQWSPVNMQLQGCTTEPPTVKDTPPDISHYYYYHVYAACISCLCIYISPPESINMGHDLGYCNQDDLIYMTPKGSSDKYMGLSRDCYQGCVFFKKSQTAIILLYLPHTCYCNLHS